MSPSVKGSTKPRVVLVLQGGGAFGAYQLGAYQALSEYGFEPDWFCGISIGAINSAILAGNKSNKRLERLREFWQRISWPEIVSPFGNDQVRSFFKTASAAQAFMFGQPHFFTPRLVSPFVAPPGSPDTISFYDTSALRETLRELVNFELINYKEVRLSLGATDVESGKLAFFDNVKPVTRIGPEHVVASGSLPPGFPATPIGNRYYWDGGCVSNTPLEAVLNDEPTGHTVVFMIDLWSASGAEPRTLYDVLWREKEIQYASRTAQHIDFARSEINRRHALGLLKKARALEISDAPREDTPRSADNRLDLVHIIYRPDGDQIANSDAEFSRISIEERTAAGYRDTRRAIEDEPWFRRKKPAYLGALVHRVAGQSVVTLSELTSETSSEKPAAA